MVKNQLKTKEFRCGILSEYFIRRFVAKFEFTIRDRIKGQRGNRFFYASNLKKQALRKAKNEN